MTCFQVLLILSSASLSLLLKLSTALSSFFSVFFTARISVWFFLMASLSWCSHFVFMLFSWFCYIIYLCSLTAHWPSTVILNILSGTSWIFICLDCLLDIYCILLVVSSFPDFSCSLYPCIAVCALKETVTFSSLWTGFRKDSQWLRWEHCLGGNAGVYYCTKPSGTQSAKVQASTTTPGLYVCTGVAAQGATVGNISNRAVLGSKSYRV